VTGLSPAGTRGSPAPIGFVLAIVAASLFGWLGPLSRWAYDLGMEPLPFVAWRAGIGALVLTAAVSMLALRGRAVVNPTAMTPTELGSLGAAAATGLLLNLAIFGAFERVTVALALIGFYTYPAMIAAVAIALGREAPSRPVLAALALALVGMVVVVAGGLDPAGITPDPVGILLALAAAASQTVFVTIARGYGRIPAEQAMGAILAGTLLGCLLIGLAAGLATELAEPIRTPSLLPIVLAAGVGGAAIPSLLFLVAIRLIGGTRAGILMLLEPVVGVGLAAWLLGEGLRPIQLAGALAVLAAAVLLQRSHGAAPPAPAAPALGAHEIAPGRPPTG
jgi:drug/metabolite transporter (DMT)-like permease